MKKYWTKADVAEIEKERSFSELYEVAELILKRMKRRGALSIGMVCGPISTGGLGSRGKNVAVFEKYIKCLRAAGVVIFSQMIFEKTFWRIMDLPGVTEDHLLNEFYYPLFRLGLVDVFYFIPGWETSYGASWEERQADLLGITKVYLMPPASP